MKLYKILILGVLIFSVVSCKKYLDVIPDNIATIDNAFSLRNQAEKYLFTCYSFLPKLGIWKIRHFWDQGSLLHLILDFTLRRQPKTYRSGLWTAK